MMMIAIFSTLVFAASVAAQKGQYTTPVPILKQINKHNEDGSYSYGYEAADGSYKIESKYSDGQVFGKYGYVDDAGQLREIEYGASRRGFEPAGNEINVAPPTLSNNYPTQALGPNQEDDGQYREDPSVYYKDDKYNNKDVRPKYQPIVSHGFSNQQSQAQQYQPQQQQYQPKQQQQYQPQYQQQSYQQQPAFRPTSNFGFNTAQQPQARYYQPQHPAYPNYNAFQGHPATNFDVASGSYSVQYKR